MISQATAFRPCRVFSAFLFPQKDSVGHGLPAVPPPSENRRLYGLAFPRGGRGTAKRWMRVGGKCVKP